MKCIKCVKVNLDLCFLAEMSLRHFGEDDDVWTDRYDKALDTLNEIYANCYERLRSGMCDALVIKEHGMNSYVLVTMSTKYDGKFQTTQFSCNMKNGLAPVYHSHAETYGEDNTSVYHVVF